MSEILCTSHINLDLDGKSILKDISFSVEEGTVTLIAGLNGSGKSMLMKSIKGLISPSSGEIQIDGKKRKRRERRKGVALVFQDANLQIVGQSVEKDIAFGLENQKRDKDEIKRITDEWIDLFNLGPLRKKDPRILSGGEKRRVAIASVLSMGPDILLLDEPLSNLDYPSTRLFLETLRDLKAMGKTVLIVSHEAEKLLALTDRTIILKDGMLISDTPSREAIPRLRENDIYIPNIPFEEMTWLS